MQGQRKLLVSLAAQFAVVMFAGVAFGDVVYVKPQACGTHDGSSWANAMGSVKDALLQSLRTSEPHEVRMSAGIHEWTEAVGNCLFEANSIVQNEAGAATGTGDVPLTILGETNDNGSFKVIGCTFRDNVVSRRVGNHANSKNGQAAIVYLKGNGGSTLVNCTFDNNTVSCVSDKEGVIPQAAVALVRDWMNNANPYYAKASVVNCTFHDNVAADGDICLAERLATTPFYLVNTISWGGAGHRTITANGAGNAEAYLWNSIVHGTDLSASFIAEAANCATTSPGSMRKWSGEAPVLGKPPEGNSVVHNGGRNVYVDGNGVLCVPTDADETSFINAATATAVTPSGERTMLADVFGEARPAGKVTLGAVQAFTPVSLMVIIQ